MCQASQRPSNQGQASRAAHPAELCLVFVRCRGLGFVAEGRKEALLRVLNERKGYPAAKSLRTCMRHVCFIRRLGGNMRPEHNLRYARQYQPQPE